jgi:hypothetical protein
VGTNRPATISILLAGAALLGGIGAAKTANGDPGTSWFAFGAAFLVLALIANFWPASGRLPWFTRLVYSRQRRRLRKKTLDGWEAGHISALKGSMLSLVANAGSKPLAGFYCEIHGPAGFFEAYSREAQTAISEAPGGVSTVLAIPKPSRSAFLKFPGDFSPQSGDPIETIHRLQTGTYHHLWWAWKRGADGMSVELVFVALGASDFQAGGPEWRRWLAEYRARRQMRRRLKRSSPQSQPVTSPLASGPPEHAPEVVAGLRVEGFKQNAEVAVISTHCCFTILALCTSRS